MRIAIDQEGKTKTMLTDRQTGELTGFPSIDKPWLKYYKKGAPNMLSPDMSIFGFLYLRDNKDHLDNNAFNYYGNKVSFRSLFHNIDLVASALQSYGVHKGEIVTLCALNTPEFIYLLYALNKIGAVSNWIGPVASKEDINKQLSNTGSKLVFTIDIAADLIAEAAENSKVEEIIVIPISNSMPLLAKAFVALKGKKNHFDGIAWSDFVKSSAKLEAVEVNGSDMAVIEYTGGSTGVPKGVMLSNQSLNTHYLNFCETNYNGVFNFDCQDKMISGVPFFLVFGLCACCHAPLCHSIELVLAPDPSPDAGVSLILKNKVNHVMAGRLLVEALLRTARAKDAQLSYIKSIMYGGEETNKKWENNILHELEKYNMNAPLLNSYGMSETSAGVLTAPDNETDGLIPCANINVRIINPDDTSIEYGYNTEGELCIASKQLMLGYYKNERATEESIFEENGVRWLKTKDLATITPEGIIKITGRIKRIYSRVDSEGIQIRVYPMRIEETLTEHELVKQSAVVGIKDDVLAYRSVAYIIPSLNGVNENDMKQQLQKHCKANLPDSHQPDEYIFVDRFPITRAGKVDYKELERMAR